MKTTKKYKYSLLMLLFLLASYSYANTPSKGKYKKTKTINKEFTVSRSNTVAIDNKYGDITITTWNKNSVSIEVVITVTSSKEELAEERFNSINIEFGQEENRVYAKTNIDKKNNKWSFFGRNMSIDTQIDYHIKMPVSNQVDLNNDYGGVFINQLDGKCKINCDYGFIKIGELNNENNRIDMDYASSSNIDFINGGKIYTDYSRLSIDKAENLILVADYTDVEIDLVTNLIYTNDYGSLKIKKAETVKGNGDYLSLKVYDIERNLKVSCDYGSIKIYRINQGFESIKINADYTTVKLGIDKRANLNFSLSTSYADINIEGLDVSFNHKEVKMFSKTFKGSINNENPNSFIKVNSSYANIKLFRAEDY